MITTDPAVPLHRCGGVINEVNTTPALHHHYDSPGARYPRVALDVVQAVLRRKTAATEPADIMHGTNGYRLAAMGDVMLARKSDGTLRPRRRFPHGRRARGTQGLRSRVPEPGEPRGHEGQPRLSPGPTCHLRARPETLDILKGLGVTLVSLGNNHMPRLRPGCPGRDAGAARRGGDQGVGAGRNYEEANRPLLISCNGRRIAFLSYAFIYSANTRMAAGIGQGWRTIAWAEFCRRFGRSSGRATMSS